MNKYGLTPDDPQGKRKEGRVVPRIHEPRDPIFGRLLTAQQMTTSVLHHRDTLSHVWFHFNTHCCMCMLELSSYSSSDLPV